MDAIYFYDGVLSKRGLMFLTCKECETKYRLDAAALGGGRMVRCSECGNIWFQDPPEDDDLPRQAEPEIEVPKPEEDDDLLRQIGIGVDETPSDDAEEPPRNFREALQEASGSIPDVVKPVPGLAPPVMEYRPMGMAAGQLGVFVFLLFTFATLIFLFLLRAPLVNHFPAMASLYKVMGIHIKAPGEGLRLTEMQAENQVDGESRSLAITARLTNISENNMDYPKMHVSLKSAYGRVLQEWDYVPEKTEVLASGEALPVELEFKDMHKDGSKVELKVAEE